MAKKRPMWQNSRGETEDSMAHVRAISDPDYALEHAEWLCDLAEEELARLAEMEEAAEAENDRDLEPFQGFERPMCYGDIDSHD